MYILKQSTAASVLVGPVLDSTGAVYTGMLIGDFTLTKNGTSAAMAAAATATHDGNGCYIIALTTGNTDTLGRLAIYANKATYTMAITRFSVLAGATFDAFITNTAGAANGLFIAGSNAATTVNVTGNITGNLSGSVGSVTAAVVLPTGTGTGQISLSGGNVTVGTNNDKANYTLSSSGLNNIVIETGCDARQAICIIASALAGLSTGVDTGSPVFKGVGVATTRISATASAGNRSAVTLTLP